MPTYILLPPGGQLDRLDQLLFSGVQVTTRESEADYILDVADGYSPATTYEDIAEFLEWVLPKKSFDTLLLAEVSTGATITRMKPVGQPNLVVKPAIFKKRVQRRPLNQGQSNQLVVHDKGSGFSGIMVTALLFFVAAVVGLIYYASKGRKKAIKHT